MDIRNLTIFIQIVEAGSVQGAARKLGLSRSAIRRCVDELESMIGAPLLHRDPTGVRLTPAGVVALAEGKTIIESAQGLITNARAAEREAWGTLRVIEPLGIPLTMHVNALLATHLALPKQRIVIRQVENPLSNLNEPFELMLHDGPAPDRNAWFSRVILRTNLRLVASREYLERRGTPKTVAELADHDTLGWNRPGHPAGEWPLLSGDRMEVKPWLVTSDAHLVTTVAAKGGGILLIPRMPFFDDLEADPFETVLEDIVGTELVFRVTTPFPHRADARTRETLEMILAQLDGLPQD
jgi:molybdate transport repressor ModE-like protein